MPKPRSCQTVRNPSPMFRFTIRDVLWLTVVVALGVSQVVMVRQLREARSEVALARKQFGYLHIDDPDRIYVSRIGGDFFPGRYRLHIPPGHRFLLHLADTEIPDTGYPENPKPTKTLSMNSWREGADIVLTWTVYKDNKAVRVEVATDTERLFDYVLADWQPASGPEEANHLQTDPQKSFSPNETIRFMWFRNPTTKRGVMLWLEPLGK